VDQSALKQHEGPLLRYAARITGDLERARDVLHHSEFISLVNRARALGGFGDP
jgi:DNA-directed RNA polymerase specialized sigma24 family protein